MPLELGQPKIWCYMVAKGDNSYMIGAKKPQNHTNRTDKYCLHLIYKKYGLVLSTWKVK